MKVFFPGTFDPFTIGHEDLVKRALTMGFEVVIGIGINEKKEPLFTITERLDAIRKHFASYTRVGVVQYNGLTVDAARANGCSAILRGVRSVTDFEYERGLADINDKIDGMETILLVSKLDLQHVSSSFVRELIHFGRNPKDMVIDTFQPDVELKAYYNKS